MKVYRGMMKKTAVIMMVGLLLAAAAPVWATEMTFTGTINEDLQLQTDDGTIYELIDDDQKVAADFIGKMVRITGSEEAEGEMKLIRVVEVDLAE
jgi:hypothetical protein